MAAYICWQQQTMSEATGTGTLSEKFKEQTKGNHQILEKKLIKKLKLVRTTNEYASLLTYFYSFFGGLELSINQHLDIMHLPD